MDKYYRQVAELQDWVDKNKQKVENSNMMSEGVANFFGSMESQVVIFNAITEVMANSLEGR